MRLLQVLVAGTLTGYALTGCGSLNTSATAPVDFNAITTATPGIETAPHLALTGGRLAGDFVPKSGGLQCFRDPGNSDQPVVSAVGTVNGQSMIINLVVRSSSGDLITFDDANLAFHYVAPATTETAGRGFTVDSDLYLPPYPPGTPSGVHISGTLDCGKSG